MNSGITTSGGLGPSGSKQYLQNKLRVLLRTHLPLILQKELESLEGQKEKVSILIEKEKKRE